ncbi:hypothetical protein KCTC52924_02968 [Arenibacter antarcticus]|uniref:GNAT family N-acetyltransferase n=1 Tax=Arenibacter antarcticus TaxID=2040469 RepID=A0ABW5VKM7_9FLAO|nr:GNAT family N-acetyltransferase [Arenibacter sp. H213]MCM4167386.1 hypothetical protein [Arenibacter sp. H213]
MKYNKVYKEDVTIDQISRLFKSVWDLDDYSKIYNKTNWAFNNDFSKILLFEDNNKLIAARGGIYWPLQIGQNSIKTVQFHGTCVHPSYRRKGIFSDINKLFLAEANEDGVDFIFNISVDISRKGYEKLGWEYISGFRRLTYIRKPLKFITHRKKQNSISDPTIDLGDIIVPQSFIEARNTKLSKTVHCKYSSEFLEWRLSNSYENYGKTQTSKGLIIYKVKNNKNGLKEVIIGEVFLLEYNYKNFSEVLKLLIDNENPDLLFTYIFKGHPCYLYFIMNLFLPNPKRYNLNFGTKFLNKGLQSNMLNKKWAICFLDIDTF